MSSRQPVTEGVTSDAGDTCNRCRDLPEYDGGGGIRYWYSMRPSQRPCRGCGLVMKHHPAYNSSGPPKAYCCNACKQKAYRKRKEQNDQG